MTAEPIKRHAQILMAATLGLSAGLVIAMRSTADAVLLALLPILVALALQMARRPVYLGIFLTLAIFINVESILSFNLDFPFGDLAFVVMVGYLIVVMLSGAERPRFGRAAQSYLAFYLVSIIIVALSPYTQSLAFEEWFKINAYAMASFFTAYVTMTNPKWFRAMVILLSWSGIVLSIVNIIEFLDRNLIDLSELPGRSAGLLINPNVSGATILACLILSYLYPSRLLIVLRVVMFAGIYTTFSRFALIAFWPTITYLELRKRRLTFKQLVATAAVVSGAVALTSYSALLVQDYSNRQVRFAYSRVIELKEGKFDDPSSQQRFRVIPINLERFQKHPFVGGGVGSASVIDAPHNEFLLLMAELGILPTLFYLLVLATVFFRIRSIADRETRQVLMTFYMCFIAYHMVTHNALSTPSHVITFAVLCVPPEILPTGGSTAGGHALVPWGSSPGGALARNLTKAVPTGSVHL